MKIWNVNTGDDLRFDDLLSMPVFIKHSNFVGLGFIYMDHFDVPDHLDLQCGVPDAMKIYIDFSINFHSRHVRRKYWLLTQLEPNRLGRS